MQSRHLCSRWVGLTLPASGTELKHVSEWLFRTWVPCLARGEDQGVGLAPVRLPRNLHLNYYFFCLPTSCQQQSVLSVLLEFPQNPLPLQGRAFPRLRNWSRPQYKRMLKYFSNIMLLAQNCSFLLFAIFFRHGYAPCNCWATAKAVTQSQACLAALLC